MSRLSERLTDPRIALVAHLTRVGPARIIDQRAVRELSQRLRIDAGWHLSLAAFDLWRRGVVRISAGRIELAASLRTAAAR